MKSLQKIRNWWHNYQLVKHLSHDWKTLCTETQTTIGDRAKDAPLKILLVPCDPWSVFGSKGDEAMIDAVLAGAKKKSDRIEVAFITADELGSQAVRARGMTALEAWRGRNALCSIVKAAMDFGPQYVFILGADVMDGYYSPATSLMLLATADVLHLRQIKVSLLGFSFNQKAAPVMGRYFRTAANHGLRFNLRDPYSFERFCRITGCPARLVADTAFMLSADQGTEQYQNAQQWCQMQRSIGNTVLGINLHPMLIAHASAAVIAGHVQVLTQVLERLMSSRRVACLLIAHDSRETVGDNISLQPLYDKLRQNNPQNVYFRPEVLTASQTKAVASLLDGLLSSRMHLAIAALSSGVPICVFSYQDKFAGLIKHFELPDNLVMPPPEQSDIAVLEQNLACFLDHLPQYRQQIQKHLPEVIKKASYNLEIL